MSDRRWWAPALWAGVILAATSIPGPELPRVPGRADLFAHLALYGVLGWLLARAAGTVRPASLAGWVALASAFGAADEWHQQFIPGRSASADDWVADSLGAALGAIVYAAAARRRREPAT